MNPPGDRPTTQVLVVDDEDIVRELLTEILRRAGFDVHGTASAAEALTYLDSTDAAVVITDIVMPHYSGLELLRDLKKSRPDTPVIVATGAASQETIEQAQQTGAFSILTKPFTHAELIRTITTALNHHPARRGANSPIPSATRSTALPGHPTR